MNLSLTKKGIFLVFIPLLTQTLFLALLIKIQSDNQEIHRRVQLHSRALLILESAFRQLEHTHAAARGYLITQNEMFADELIQSQKIFSQEMNLLEILMADNSNQLDRIHQIQNRAEKLFSWFGEQNSWVRQGKIEDAVNRVKSLQGKKLIDEARGRLEEFLQEEGNAVEQRIGQANETARQLTTVLFAGGIFSLVITLLITVVFFRNVTQRLRILQENLGRLAEGRELIEPIQGEDEIAEIDHSFRLMAQDLDQQRRENDMFVYSVSHDLRSPLVNLQGFSQELKTSCQDLHSILEESPMPEDLKNRARKLLDRNIAKSLQHIQAGVHRLSGIIDAMLKLSRAGRVVYQFQMVDLQVLFQRILESMEGTISEKKATVQVKDLPPAWGDPVALEQVFANLLSNALKYSEPQRPLEIEVGCLEATAKDPSWRTYYVKDNGLGIAESYQHRLFGAFQRFHTDVASGEGIGLALVRRTLERHGGTIRLESAEGQGSTFLLTLPVRNPLSLPAGLEEKKLAVSETPKEIPPWQPIRS